MNEQDVSNNHIECSFCGKNRKQVDQIIEGPVRHGHHIYICNECVTMSFNVLNEEEKPPKKKREKILTPTEIKTHLDQYVVSQEDAKIALSVAVYNHFKRTKNKSETELDKSNILMIGPSGSGKTLMVKSIAKLFDIPYVIADATSFTEAGYVGNDTESLINQLIANAGGDIERAKSGIIFVDEIDKKGKKNDVASTTRDISGEGVQQSFLKLMEGTILNVESDLDTVEFDTSGILFVFSGSFVGLDDIIRKGKTSIGINADLPSKSNFSNVVKSVTTDDLIKYGMIPEFVGRCPVTVVLDDLDIETLVKILTEPKNNIVNQFKALFKIDGVKLEFDDKYLYNIAERCIKQKIGARGLRSIMEKDLQQTQFMLPQLAKKGINKIFVDSTGLVKNIYKTNKRANNE